jgi:hypothetical protein
MYIRRHPRDQQVNRSISNGGRSRCHSVPANNMTAEQRQQHPVLPLARSVKASLLVAVMRDTTLPWQMLLSMCSISCMGSPLAMMPLSPAQTPFAGDFSSILQELVSVAR